MITYALTAPSPFGKYISESVAAAIRKSKFRNFELTFSQYIKDDEQSRTAARLTRQLIDEGIIHPVSVHLPFTGGGLIWDPSTLDEDLRKDVSARQIRMIRDHADQMALSFWRREKSGSTARFALVSCQVVSRISRTS